MDQPIKILILEDDADDVEIVVNHLKKSKLLFRSELASDRNSFIHHLNEFKPDIILSDNSIPQFNATEALTIIKKDNLDIPFILLTGAVTEDFAASIIKLGAADFLLKDRLARLPSAINAAIQKRDAEVRLRSKETELAFKADLLSAVGQSVIATDMNGRVTYWNNAAEQMYGWTIDEAIGRSIMELTPVPENIEQAQAIMKYMKSGQTWKGDFIVQRKDGTAFPAFVSNSPILDKQGELVGIIGVSSDMTEKARAHQELRELEKRIMQSQIQHQKMITRAIITAQEEERNHIGQELHDNISQILAGTKLYLGVASKKSDELNDLLRYPLELLEESINEIRLLSARQVTPVKNINLEKLIETLVDQLRLTTSIKTLFVCTVDDASLQDELKLNVFRIIQEQVNNIIKHAGAYNVTISVEQSDGMILIDIIDDGKGFDPTAERHGIGISNMMNRIESFNGEIYIESSAGNGCRVKAAIPI